MHDLVIRGGTVLDGTGAPARTADVAIDGDRIAAVGDVAGRGEREIDARDLLVTPGFVDIHTHYDGQVTWDPHLTPSCWHGVTSVVMGNCGVGFAPVRPDRRDWLIGLMEGVEDIPGTALAEGIDWQWETFPEYLDALDRKPRSLDVAAQVPHGALRAYVMGERGANNEAANADDIRRMAELVAEGLRAGALGFSSSRTILHRSVDGVPVPGTYANNAELLGIGRMLGEVGHGVFEVASDLAPEESELGWMEDLARQTGRPVLFGLLQQDLSPNQWRRLLRATEQAAGRGAPLRAQIALRGTGILMHLDGTVHPFMRHPTYQRLAHLPLAERVEQLRRDEVRTALFSETGEFDGPLMAMACSDFPNQYILRDPPDYEPAAEDSVAAHARRAGVPTAEFALDTLLGDAGEGILYYPMLNYTDRHLAHVVEMLSHPHTVNSLADGGAHCGTLCDAGATTFALTHFGRDRIRGDRVSLEHLVHRQSQHTAQTYGLHDRGVLAQGYLADLNVIDFDELELQQPVLVDDLPAGGKRFVQRASGYRQTIKAGEVTFEDGEATGQMPGRLIRGPQVAPG